jgi:cytoskeletal protein CcmA (bactofilin family)
MPQDMPIFRRAPAPGLPTAAAPAAGGVAGDAAAGERRGGAATVIAAGTRIEGEVSGTADLQVEGEIAGNVDVDALVVVGARGSVLGPLHGRVVRISGQVAGNVTAAERVEVGAAGSVEGDIAAPRVVIAEGAFFKGKIEMKSDQNPEPRRAARAGASAPDQAAAQEPRNAEAAEAGSE